METRVSRALASNLGNSGTSFLEPEVARRMLFEKILDQLADSSLFSSGISPTIFIVYAHNNETEGAAYDECVRKLITWLERVHARILSDHSPLPPFVSKIEGTNPIGNILGNQMCLLPPSCYGVEIPKVRTVDKVIVCGSEVMEAYCRRSSAQAFIEEIVQICNNSTDHPANMALESAIRERVEKECSKDDFHHVLTEIAFLKVRKLGLTETHNMVPVVLSQINPDDAPMKYLPVFWNTDVKLKLNSPETASLHRLFFKLLKQLFQEGRDFVKSFEQCYNRGNEDLELLGGAGVIQDEFANIVNRRVTEAYQEYWKISCVLMRDGRLQAYTTKLSDRVSQALEQMTQSTQHDILEWLSPHTPSKYHGVYHDSETRRMQGSCDWVIRDEKFRRWYAFEGSALLLLCGNMGTGKTYATSRVVDWVKDGLSTNDNNGGFAYFYCNKQDPARSEPKEILRNIVRQLATGPWKDLATKTVVHKSVYALWLKDREQGILSTFAEWEDCLLELIDTYPRTTIVLDALDECKMQQRQDLIKLLGKLASRKSDTFEVKVFVASRPEDDVRGHLERYNIIRMEKGRNAQDIASFVRTKISQHRRWSKIPQHFQNEIIDTLMEKSGGMFLFASLQIPRLLDCNTQIALRNRLSTLPNSLNNIYEEIYRSATSDPDERKLLDRALKWVLCSAKPLTTEELLLAVSQDPESDRMNSQNQDLDEELMLAWTKNLLDLEVGLDHEESDDEDLNQIVSDEEGSEDVSLEQKILDSASKALPVWRLAHQAVAEFLEASTTSNSGLAHFEAGKVCLTVLIETFGADPNESRSDVREAPGYHEDSECPCERTTGSDVRNNLEMPNPLKEYAVYGWPTHVRAHENDGARSIDGLSRTLRKFLGHQEESSQAYKRWLECSSKPAHTIPEWSLFKTRPMHIEFADNTIMPPMTLACHLGLYTCLLDWWGSSSIHYERTFDVTYWMPSLGWQALNVRPGRSRWSLVALACVHDETNIIKHLLGRKVRVNTRGRDNVPPIVAATVADSAEIVEDLIKRGADICSSFTYCHGHLLLLATQVNSLGVMRLLLQQPSLSGVLEVEAILASFEYGDFRSAEAMEILIGTGVNVNKPLRVGTLLIAAATRGWDNVVRSLLDKGAKVDPQTRPWHYPNALEAVTFTSSNPSTVALLVNHGAHVNAKVVERVWNWATLLRSKYYEVENPLSPLSHEADDWNEILQLLLACKPDLNETWIDSGGNEISALIRAVREGNLDKTRFLLRHGARADLHVGGKYSDPLGCVFQMTLGCRLLDWPYPIREMIDALVEGGASLQSLEGDHLHNALAAAAFVGLEDMVQDFLNLGASPYTCCDHEYRSALGAAAASDNAQAPAIVRKLLNTGPDVSTDYGFFQTALLALDSPLLNLIISSVLNSEWNQTASLEVWLESASVLALQHAIWDIDLMQWNECLKLTRPKFWEQNAEPLAKLEQILAQNRTNFFLKFPGAASDKQWSIKDAKDAKASDRYILQYMKEILGWHNN